MGRIPNAVRAVCGLALTLAVCGKAVHAQPPQTETIPAPRAALGAPVVPTLSLADLTRISLERNPQLQEAGLAIEGAQGKALQAGLYPNPVLYGTFDELGDRTGPGGINTFPGVTQEIVTAKKLQLSRAVAEREIDQATFVLARRRYELLTTVRRGYFHVLTLQRRVEVLEELKKLAEDAYTNAEQLRKAQQIARLDVLQFSVQLNRLTAQLEATQKELKAAWFQLTASMGVPELPPAHVTGSLDAPLPDYNFPAARDLVAHQHPSVRYAMAGVARAQVALRRAEVEKYPNVTLGTGYTRQNQNKSDDWRFEFSLPIPAFDRNQGNVLSARAEVGQAHQQVRATQNDLLNELADAFGRYAAARKRVERYRDYILKDADEAFRLSLAAFRGGQFEYLRVLQAQQAIAETNLEYLQAQSEAWLAASDISGLLLLEHWPPTLVPVTAPAGQPQNKGDAAGPVLPPAQ